MQNELSCSDVSTLLSQRTGTGTLTRGLAFGSSLEGLGRAFLKKASLLRIADVP